MPVIRTTISDIEATRCNPILNETIGKLRQILGNDQAKVLNVLGTFHGAELRRCGAVIDLDEPIRTQLHAFSNAYEKR